MRRVDITGIALEANTGAPLVVLREQDEPNRLLPIFIGGPEASAIAIAAAGERTPRPMVHDVMAALVTSLDGQVSGIEVTDVQDGTFFAVINITGPAGDRKVGSRPSDALALAVRTGAPVFVSDQVLDIAGSVPEVDEGGDQSQLEPELAPAEIDAEVDSFRSFLDELDPSDFVDTEAIDGTEAGRESGEVDDAEAGLASDKAHDIDTELESNEIADADPGLASGEVNDAGRGLAADDADDIDADDDAADD